MSQHAFFILSSYLVTALVIAGLIVRAFVDHRVQTRALAELEARGVGRRSRGSRSPLPAGDRPAQSAG